jgi:hypothetical protein
VQNDKLDAATSLVEDSRNSLGEVEAEIDCDYLPEGAQPRGRIQRRDALSLVSISAYAPMPLSAYLPIPLSVYMYICLSPYPPIPHIHPFYTYIHIHFRTRKRTRTQEVEQYETALEVQRDFTHKGMSYRYVICYMSFNTIILCHIPLSYCLLTFFSYTPMLSFLSS